MLGALVLAGCIEDRERPAPPRLTITLDRTTVRSINPPAKQDSVAGTVDARDPDGLDSVWVSVDMVESGQDGGFNPSFTRRFNFTVQAGKGLGSQIPVRLRARDLAGFQAQRDTYVVVIQ